MLSPHLNDAKTMMVFGIERGTENELEEKGGKKTLLLVESQFVQSLALAIPRCILGEFAFGASVRRSMDRVVLLHVDNEPVEKEKTPLARILLDGTTEITYRSSCIKVAVPVMWFALRAEEYLQEAGQINLAGFDFEFRREFVEMWNRLTWHKVPVPA
ncbi:MAG: hypothetical protein V1885_00225 [Candidatus Brennerbacteria bacterium]